MLRQNRRKHRRCVGRYAGAPLVPGVLSVSTTSPQVLGEQRLVVLLRGPALDPVLVLMQCAACAAGELLRQRWVETLRS